MLNPLSRLKAALASNPRAASVVVYAGDAADVCFELNAKDPAVAKVAGLATEAERPGVEIRVPAQDLTKVIDLASRKGKEPEKPEPKNAEPKKPEGGDEKK